ncbi:hypothetical protein Syun_003534 [Stephania yunnanensis]|uniref:Uncharacterized protein n=1 Tax=Stephania yunnanensis TaxID=152371 RepID=A0AAP0L2Y6_9MAGN
MQSSVKEVVELYGSEKSFVVEVQRALSGLHYTALIALEREKEERYADPGASTSQMPEMVPRSEFDIVAEQLRKVVAFMHQQFGMTMD